FSGPFEMLTEEVNPVSGKIVELPIAAGYLLSHQTNDSFIAVNRLLRNKEDVYWLRTSFTADGKTYPPGTDFIAAKPATLPELRKIAQETGLSFDAVATFPTGDVLKLRPPRIALWDKYGGSVPSGWTRYVLERFDFPFTVVEQTTIDRGDFGRTFDVLVLVDDAVS